MMTSAFRPQPDGIPIINMAPLAEATLDYTEDWSQWLSSGETILSVTWVLDTGITSYATQFAATTATIWLTGGALGTVYLIQCTITTSMGRTDTRSFRVRIIQR